MCFIKLGAGDDNNWQGLHFWNSVNNPVSELCTPHPMSSCSGDNQYPASNLLIVHCIHVLQFRRWLQLAKVTVLGICIRFIPWHSFCTVFMCFIRLGPNLAKGLKICQTQSRFRHTCSGYYMMVDALIIWIPCNFFWLFFLPWFWGC